MILLTKQRINFDMNIEILKKNIDGVINKPYYSKLNRKIKENGIGENPLTKERYIMVKVSTDDTSWRCALTDDYVSRILAELSPEYRDKLVTLKHDDWLECSYEPVFDTDTQAIWDKKLNDFYEAKQKWCDEYGCD